MARLLLTFDSLASTFSLQCARHQDAMAVLVFSSERSSAVIILYIILTRRVSNVCSIITNLIELRLEILKKLHFNLHINNRLLLLFKPTQQALKGYLVYFWYFKPVDNVYA